MVQDRVTERWLEGDPEMGLAASSEETPFLWDKR
jgi:hypothetical protein